MMKLRKTVIGLILTLMIALCIAPVTVKADAAGHTFDDLFAILREEALNWDGTTRRVVVDVSEEALPYYDTYGNTDIISGIFINYIPELFYVEGITVTTKNSETVNKVHIFYNTQYSLSDMLK